jgi:hypothetical protein
MSNFDSIIDRAKNFFRDEIVKTHFDVSLSKASDLKEYNINPFLLKYLATFLCGDSSAKSMALALIYPRVLGTSISTSFGMQTQKMVSFLFEGQGSSTHGIDIEFIDTQDNRKKYCQLKAGPNTINKDDVTTILTHFKGAKNLARTNSLDIRVTDLIVGVLYGAPDDLSGHYKSIDNHHPVFVGQEF